MARLSENRWICKHPETIYEWICLNIYYIDKKKVKVKQSLYRPGQALRVPGGWGSQISRQSAHEGGKVVSPTHRPHLHPSKYSWLSFLLEAESVPGPLRHSDITKWGIEPATFRVVAQCLNQLLHHIPHINNLLKPTCYVMHQQFNIQQLYALPTLYLCVLYLSENKQRLVPLTA